MVALVGDVWGFGRWGWWAWMGGYVGCERVEVYGYGVVDRGFLGRWWRDLYEWCPKWKCSKWWICIVWYFVMPD